MNITPTSKCQNSSNGENCDLTIYKYLEGKIVTAIYFQKNNFNSI